jgi:RloB-like protein
MGQDNQPKHRQAARNLQRRQAVRQPFRRILIVSEGEKTEPQYLNEIRTELRLSTAHVMVQPGGFGTEPTLLVSYAEHLFRNGDRGRGVEAVAFDHIYVVFDRDDHRTYHQALAQAAGLNNRLQNDEGKRIPFEAVVSVPCFEVWLLLHFEEVVAPIHRDDVYARLRAHLPGYAKGGGGHWATTKHLRTSADERAKSRAETTNSMSGVETYTDMHRLVDVLTRLRD